MSPSPLLPSTLLTHGQPFQLGPYRANGFSVGSRVSFLALPKLDLIFDLGWCVEPMRGISRAFVSHLHIDHSIAMATWLCWRQANIKELGPPCLYVPKESVDATHSILKGFQEAQRYAFQYQLIGLQPGDTVELERKRFLSCFRTTHYLPTLGFSLHERRKRLKDQYRGLKGQDIQKLKQQGVDCEQEVTKRLLVYTSDTCPKLFEQQPELLEAELLVTECSDFEGVLEYQEGDRSSLGEPKHSHNHIRPLAQKLKDFKGQHLVFNHLPLHYQRCDLRAFLLPRLPAAQRPKLALIPYRSEPPRRPFEPCPERAQQRIEAWPMEAMPRSHWQPSLDTAESEAVAFEWRGDWITPRSAQQLYEDALTEFLKAQPELLDWLCEGFGELLCKHPSEVEAGFDYAGRALEPGCFQDIAIRRALRRLGRWFEGSGLLEVSDRLSEGYVLNPGLVPFHEPEAIVQPAVCEDPELDGSLACFWRSNRVWLKATPA